MNFCNRTLLLFVHDWLFSIFTTLLFLSISLQSQAQSISSLIDLAINLEYENPDSAIAIYKVTRRLALDKDSLDLEAKSLYYTGLVYMQQGSFDTCQYYLDIAYQKYVTLGDEEYQYKVLLAKANNLNHQGKNEEALLAYQRALDAAEKLGDRFAQSQILCNQSSIFAHTNRTEYALLNLKKALALAPSESLGLQASIYNNFSMNYQTLGKFDSALYYIDMAIELYRSQKDDVDEALALANRAAYLHEIQPPRLPESKRCLDRTRSILDTINLPGLEVHYWKHLTYYLYKKLQFSEAEKAAEICLGFLEKYPEPRGLATIHEILYSIQKEYGNYDQALAHHEKWVALRDTMVFADNLTQLQELQAKYESTKKDNEIVEQSLLISRRTEQRNLLLGGLAILGLLIWFLTYRHVKNKRLNEEKITNLKNHQKILVMDSMLQGQEEERKRIAQDLHDGLGTLLAAARMQMQTIQREVDKMGELNLVNKTEKLIAGACLEVRRISHDMMPSALSDLGFVAAIEDLVDEIKIQRELIFHQKLPEEINIRDGLALNLYRIIQEILQNVVKHSNANIVELSISEQNDELFIRIFDDGIGIDVTDSGDGIGISNIRSRVHYLNGKLNLHSDMGEGCLYEIWLPKANGTQ